jgi:tRNA dimethylallyltransferase
MQMYDGLPIITNKITSEEQKSIPHHLLGIVGLDEKPWRVGVFKKKAGSVMKEIRSRGKLPILVGGTHYYTQSLLFKDALISDAAQSEEETGEELSREEINRRYPILEKPTEEILEQLRTVDPVMADRWHPNDRRKIQRSLEIYLMTGKQASKLYEEQQERNGSHHGGDSSTPASSEANVAPLFQSALVFWVHANTEVLSKRLDERVDTMLKVGLINEVKTLDKFLREKAIAGISIDRSSGIWVSIGFKEFEPYMEAMKSGGLSRTELQVLFAAAVERTKAATRQYAKRQIRWIRLKLLVALSKVNSLSSIYLLDGSNLDHWLASVSGPAIDIAYKFLAKQDLPAPRDMSPAATEMLTPKQTFEFSDRRDLWIRQTCELCNMTAVTDEQWQRHIKGRGHRRAVKKSNKNASHGRSQAQSNDITADTESP